jgi:sugar lactone lactonase YvrE
MIPPKPCWGVLGWLVCSNLASSQELLVANNQGQAFGSVARFSSGGNYLGDLRSVGNWFTPGALTFDSAGNLYVAHRHQNAIYRYTHPDAAPQLFASIGLNSPTGLTFNSQGQLVVCNYEDGTISFFSAEGDWLRTSRPGLLYPVALALDAEDAIYVSTPSVGAFSGVFRLNADGTEQTLLIPGSRVDARGLAFDAAGQLYVADQLGQCVHQFTPEGYHLAAFTRSTLRDPFALAFNPEGDLFISSQVGGVVWRYSVAAEQWVVFATLPDGTGNPVGLSFTPVPEPAAGWMLAGVLGLLRRHRR